jgi:DNA-binding MarR family transcriptional regulator
MKVTPVTERFKSQTIFLAKLLSVLDDAACLPPDFCIPRADENRPPLLLAKAGAVLIDSADEAMKPLGLDGRDYSILAILDADGPGSQLELAKLLGKAPAIVVSAIDGLEQRGLVERQRDPADRRRSRVVMTKKGGEKLAEADALAEQMLRGLLSGLGEDELAQLHDLLLRGLGVAGRTGSALAS